jgi:hypothetical protein
VRWWGVGVGNISNEGIFNARLRRGGRRNNRLLDTGGGADQERNGWNGGRHFSGLAPALQLANSQAVRDPRPTSDAKQGKGGVLDVTVISVARRVSSTSVSQWGGLRGGVGWGLEQVWGRLCVA